MLCVYSIGYVHVGVVLITVILPGVITVYSGDILFSGKFFNLAN